MPGTNDFNTSNMNLDDIDLNDSDFDDGSGVNDQGQQSSASSTASQQRQQRQQNPSLMQRLQQTSEQLAQSQMLNDMLKDKDFGSLMQAKAAKKQVGVFELDEQGHPIIPGSFPRQQAENVDITKLDQPGLVKYMMNEMRKEFKTQVGQIEEKLGQRLGVHDQHLQAQRETAAQQSIDSARQEFPDFDVEIPAMQILAQRNPNLNAVELYSLAKLNKGEPVVRRRQLRTEMPSRSVTRPSMTSQRKQQTPTGGRAGYNAMVARLSQAASQAAYDTGLMDDSQYEH